MIVTGSSAEFYFQQAVEVLGLQIGKDVILKNMPTPLVRRYLLHIVAVPLLYAVYSGMAGQVGGYVHVCLGTLYLLPRMLRKRRMIQCAARRRVEEIHARLT